MPRPARGRKKDRKKRKGHKMHRRSDVDRRLDRHAKNKSKRLEPRPVLTGAEAAAAEFARQRRGGEAHGQKERVQPAAADAEAGQPEGQGREVVAPSRP